MLTGERLIDVMARHQIYLEGVKLNYAQEFSSVLQELNAAFEALFARLRVESLGELSKEKLNGLIKEIMGVQVEIYNAYAEKLDVDFVKFLEVELLINKILYASMETEAEKPLTEEESDKAIAAFWLDGKGSPTMPLSYMNGSSAATAKVWSKVLNAPLPANGAMLSSFIKAFMVSASASVESLTRKGYANGWSVEETLAAIIGTKAANYRDGQFFRINSQADAVISTIIQHASSIVNAAVSSFIYDRYQWVSVIDSVTTDICRSRNGKVFEYGKGPLPPAHIRCRSKVIPYAEKAAEIPTYHAWISKQPALIQDDILGEKGGAALRSGKLTAKDLKKFDNPKPLSLSGFVAKIKNMLT